MRDDIVAVAARHHASNLRVFGSVAAGSDTPSSDLDLLVHFSDEASLYDQVGLIWDLEDLLGLSVDVISDGAAGVDRIKHAVAV
jgi:predicted nucleotidyltransferase